METDILESIGFSKEESQIYIVLLKEGKSKALQISKITDIERTQTYRILESMIKKGFITYKDENRIKTFTAINPEMLLLELKEKEKRLKEYLPTLNILSNKKINEPTVEIYKGLNGIKNLARETLKNKQDYDLLCTKIPGSNLNYFLDYFMKAIEKANIKERILIEEDTIIDFKSKNTKIKYLPKTLEYKTTTAITKDKIALIIWYDPFLAIVIKDKNIAKTYQSYFELLWSTAKNKT